MSSTDTDPYLLAVVERLRLILGPLEWNADRAVALGIMLHIYPIECTDGMVINGDTGESILGWADVAQILEVLCDEPRRSWSTWKAVLPASGSPRYPSELEFMRDRIRQSPWVARFEG